MAKRAEIFLRVPQGPPGAPLAENKLLWQRRATVAGQTAREEKSVSKSKFLRNFFFADPNPQTQPKETRGEGGEAVGRMGGWGEGGAGWGTIPFTYIPTSGGGSLHLLRVATLSPSHPPLTGYFLEASGSVNQLRESFWGPWVLLGSLGSLG